MRHQDRQGRICQDVPGGSAENHLSQPALGIGALDQQVTLERRCVRQNGLTGAATVAVGTRVSSRAPRTNRTGGFPAYGSHLGCMTAIACRMRSSACDTRAWL